MDSTIHEERLHYHSPMRTRSLPIVEAQAVKSLGFNNVWTYWWSLSYTSHWVRQGIDEMSWKVRGYAAKLGAYLQCHFSSWDTTLVMNWGTLIGSLPSARLWTYLIYLELLPSCVYYYLRWMNTASCHYRFENSIYRRRDAWEGILWVLFTGHLGKLNC